MFSFPQLQPTLQLQPQQIQSVVTQQVQGLPAKPIPPSKPTFKEKAKSALKKAAIVTGIGALSLGTAYATRKNYNSGQGFFEALAKSPITAGKAIVTAPSKTYKYLTTPKTAEPIKTVIKEGDRLPHQKMSGWDAWTMATIPLDVYNLYRIIF